MAFFKYIFHKLNTREKTLLTAIIWVAVIFWISTSIESTTKTLKDWKRTGFTLEENARKLAQESVVEAELKEAYTKLDPSKTFNKNKLNENVDTLARQQQLTGQGFNSKQRDSQSYDLIQVHYVELSVNAKLDKLIAFDKKLKEKSPYIALEDISIRSKQSNPEELSAKFIIKALELKNNANL